MKIFLTRRMPDAGMEILKRAGEVRLGVDSETSAVPRKSLLDGVQAADVLVSMLTESVDRELLEAGSRLLGVANYAVGYNNVDLVSATELGMPVTNTPGVLTDTTADLAWALLMAVARNIVPADRYMRSGRFRLWGPNLFLGADVSRGGSGERKVLGIVGFGRVGQAVARRAQGFDMRVLAHDPVLKDLIAKTGGVEYAELDDLLAQSDFVTLHTLLDESTRHLIDARSFEKMKPTAYLINTSRGPVVDEKALVEALGRKRIAGAALDVFENEPEMTPGLAELDNVVVVPHIASASRDTRDQMATKCAENAVALLRREKAPNCVNPEVYDTDAYRRRLQRQ
jgi:glyoxylate reductase